MFRVGIFARFHLRFPQVTKAQYHRWQSLPTLPKLLAARERSASECGGSGEHSGGGKARTPLKALGPSDGSDLDVLTKQAGLVHRSVATDHNAFSISL
jgi:hypothetical protein